MTMAAGMPRAVMAGGPSPAAGERVGGQVDEVVPIYVCATESLAERLVCVKQG